MMASAFSRAYTLNPCFRAEPSNTPRHLAEFWMLEAELSFLDNLPELMDVVEDCLKETTSLLLKDRLEELEFCSKWIDKEALSRSRSLMEQEFARLSYTEAIEILKRVKRTWQYPVKWGLGLQSEHERYLAEEYCQKPVFVS
jgi:asparaginyl-tRNA synthetase